MKGVCYGSWMVNYVMEKTGQATRKVSDLML